MPVAIFILVIMALLAAGIIGLASQSNRSALQEEFSNRAFYAAESGASWAVTRLLTETGMASKVDSDSACTFINAGTNGQINFSADGLSDCSAQVSCDLDEDVTTNISYYKINSAGSCGTWALRATRRLEVGLRSN